MSLKKMIVFVDECTFSPKSYTSTVWQMPGQTLSTQQKDWDQRCVAVIGATHVTLGKLIMTMT